MDLDQSSPPHQYSHNQHHDITTPPPQLLTLSPTTHATQILLSGGWTEGELGKHWQGKSSSLSDNLDATYHHDLNDLEIVPFHFLLTNWLVQPSSMINIHKIMIMIIRAPASARLEASVSFLQGERRQLAR